MAKRVRMVLYGEPGVGKSTFMTKAPNPLYLCTDGNFDWLGLSEDHCIKLTSWDQAKKVFKLIEEGKYDNFETIVIDLLEGLYVWAEKEFCDSKKIEHIGDYKSMGAGYSLVRKEFFAELSKLLAVDKNIVFISHAVIKTEKNRVGFESHKYYPSDKISIEKQWDDIEGQVRYFLRAYVKAEEVDGKIKKRRYLSLIPKENEYGIARGLEEDNTPEDIELDWDVFAQVIGLNDEPKVTPKVAPKLTPKVTPVAEAVTEHTVEPEDEEEPTPTPTPTPAPTPAPAPKIIKPLPKFNAPKAEVVEAKQEEVEPEVVNEEQKVVPTPTPAPQVQKQELSQDDKVAAIKAKLAKFKAAK